MREHLPEFRLQDPLADAAVALRDLLCHRTGMPRHDMLWVRSGRGRAEVIRRFGRALPNAGFRERYQYNNIGYLSAGEVCARVAGFVDYDDFIRARLTRPLGMAGIVSRWPELQAHPEKASGHRRDKGSVVSLPWRDYDNVGGAGCLCGTGEDFAAWLRFQLSGGQAPDGTSLANTAALRETHTPQVVEPAMDEEGRRLYPETTPRGYAMGWSVFDYRGGHQVLSHAGAQNGFRLRAALAPDSGVGVFVLEPRDCLGAYNELQKRDDARAEQRREQDTQERHPGTHSSREWDAYAGAYEDPTYGIATVTCENDTLYLTWSGFTATRKHWHVDTFRAASEDETFDGTRMQFVLAPDGTVATLNLFGVDFRRRTENEKGT